MCYSPREKKKQNLGGTFHLFFTEFHETDHNNSLILSCFSSFYIHVVGTGDWPSSATPDQ